MELFIQDWQLTVPPQAWKSLKENCVEDSRTSGKEKLPINISMVVLNDADGEKIQSTLR